MWVDINHRHGNRYSYQSVYSQEYCFTICHIDRFIITISLIRDELYMVFRYLGSLNMWIPGKSLFPLPCLLLYRRVRRRIYSSYYILFSFIFYFLSHCFCYRFFDFTKVAVSSSSLYTAKYLLSFHLLSNAWSLQK